VITVRLAAEAFTTICREAGASTDGCETGGILLGYDTDERGEALALEAGGPGPRAERRPDFFQRDLKHAQKLADEAYARTCARWIGEWHTHPGQLLGPSRKDLQTYRSILRNPELHFSSFLSLIVSAKDDQWNQLMITGWAIEQRGLLPALLLPTAEAVGVVVDLPPLSLWPNREPPRSSSSAADRTGLWAPRNSGGCRPPDRPRHHHRARLVRHLQEVLAWPVCREQGDDRRQRG
jgi:integrative and conjugative element protein (TIGR02256 family)